MVTCMAVAKNLNQVGWSEKVELFRPENEEYSLIFWKMINKHPKRDVRGSLCLEERLRSSSGPAGSPGCSLSPGMCDSAGGLRRALVLWRPRGLTGTCQPRPSAH